MDKEVYENGMIRLEIDPRDKDHIWIQCGLAGFYVTKQQDVQDLFELLKAYLDDDAVQKDIQNLIHKELFDLGESNDI